MDKKLDITTYKTLVFDLDNVLYPEKDYLIQVYYLFAQFMEYTEQMNAQNMVDFMKEVFEKEGREDIFEKTSKAFSIPEKYKHNFKLLHITARLPLKLLMYKSTLNFMQKAAGKGKQLILLADGNPEIQINKIRQLEWNGLETSIKVYFTEELAKSRDLAIVRLCSELKINSEQLLLVDEII